MWRRRWSPVPRAVAAAVLGEALVLAYGTVVHVVQLLAGWPPYPWAPAWLAGYFIALTVLDALAAWLLTARRRAGLYLGAAVLVSDALANGYASYCLPVGTVTSRVAQAVISVLALASVILVPRARPWLRPASARMGR